MDEPNKKCTFAPMLLPPLELSDEFKDVLDALEQTRKSMFITGKAGTGKSTLLQLFRNTTQKNVVVVAPTGVAALNVGGQTIHSFFGFPPKLIEPRDIKKRYQTKLYKKLDVLIIDEISMVRADMIDNIDYFLRLNRENNQTFGGVQVVFFGDLFQLPPVIAGLGEQEAYQLRYDVPYYFGAQVFQRGYEMEMVELRKVYRQEERHFIQLLDAVRTNRVDYEELDELNRRYMPSFPVTTGYVTLSSRNSIVDQINQRELTQLKTQENIFIGQVSGAFDSRLFPTEIALTIKEGAQVMFIKNDPQKQYVNGTIGKIIHLDGDEIRVQIEKDDGRKETIEVQKAQWEVLKYKINEADGKVETEVIGTFKQYPLRLAWAMTIHKSQGKTFDRVIIDLGTGAFEHGQTYVALSRCRTFEGIVLKQKLRPQDIMTDERVVQFYETYF